MTKICTKSWNTNYQYRLGKLRLQTLNMRRSYLKQCHLYKLVHGLSIFPNSPVTTSSSHSYPTRSNHNLSLHVPSCHTNAYYYSFFVMPYVPGTHYLTLLRHYLALIYLKRLCLIIYSYCCACTVHVLFYFWVHTRISTIVAIYVSHVFWHKLLYTKKKKKKQLITCGQSGITNTPSSRVNDILCSICQLRMFPFFCTFNSAVFPLQGPAGPTGPPGLRGEPGAAVCHLGVRNKVIVPPASLTHAHTHAHAHSHAHACRTHAHAHTHSHTCTLTCTRTHAHTHTHARTHTHTHTRNRWTRRLIVCKLLRVPIRILTNNNLWSYINFVVFSLRGGSYHPSDHPRWKCAHSPTLNYNQRFLQYDSHFSRKRFSHRTFSVYFL